MKRLRTLDYASPRCEACHYPAPLQVVKVFEGSPKQRSAMLCELCRNSITGQTVTYFENFTSQMAYPMQAAMFAANAVLDQLGAFEGSPTDDARSEAAEPETSE